jgi:hypothetical protein
MGILYSFPPHECNLNTKWGLRLSARTAIPGRPEAPGNTHRRQKAVQAVTMQNQPQTVQDAEHLKDNNATSID